MTHIEIECRMALLIAAADYWLCVGPEYFYAKGYQLPLPTDMFPIDIALFDRDEEHNR